MDKQILWQYADILHTVSVRYTNLQTETPMFISATYTKYSQEHLQATTTKGAFIKSRPHFYSLKNI
jgi:hypothetical protein